MPWSQTSPPCSRTLLLPISPTAHARTGLSNATMPETISGVIVHHAHCLHEGVTNRRPDEFEASAQQVVAHPVRLSRPRWYLLKRAPLIHLRHSADKIPEISIEGPELDLNRQEGLRVAHRAVDFEAVPNNAWIAEYTLDPGRCEPHHSRRVETNECLAVGLSLLEDRLPAQTSLRPLECEELKKNTIVMNRYAPLRIVVSDVERSSSPATTSVLIHGVLSRRVN